MYEINIEELEEYISTNEDLKGYKIYINLTPSDKKDSHKGFVKSNSYKFNISNDLDKDIHFAIYKDVVEISSESIRIPSYASSLKRKEDWRKELSDPQRIMEAFSLYFGAIYA